MPTSTTSTTNQKVDPVSVLNGVKMAYSTLLLLFSIAVVMTLIFQRQTRLSADVHPSLAFLLTWVCVIWLSMVEGGQGALVGLPPVQKVLYKESHPITHQICTVAHKNDNLDRYLMGRQFLVILIVFLTNLAGAPLDDDEWSEPVFGLPEWFQNVFVSSGLAMILMTTNIGQLAAQVNASHCMLDYINTHFMTVTLYVALTIEASGLLHASYLVQMAVSHLSKTKVTQTATGSAPRQHDTPLQAAFFWLRCLLSLGVLGFSLAVTLSALLHGQTTMWEGVPPFVSILLFFILMAIIGTLEGMQIAFFAVTKLPASEQGKHPIALKTCHLLFSGEGRNLPGFMIGRQICVTLCFFLVARVTSLDVDLKRGDETVFGVPEAVQEFFDTGLLGAVITTIVGSISWQLVASAFPLAFLSNPLVYLLLRGCLWLEATGVCSASWVLAWIHKRVAHFEVDETYIGTPEERAAVHKRDDEEALHVQAGHMYPGVPVLPPGAGRLVATAEEVVQGGGPSASSSPTAATTRSVRDGAAEEEETADETSQD